MSKNMWINIIQHFHKNKTKFPNNNLKATSLLEHKTHISLENKIATSYSNIA